MRTASATAASPPRTFSLSGSSRARLLAIARETVRTSLLDAPPLVRDEELPEELLRPSGAFVTLRRRSDGELRGCVGYVEPLHPLHETVARAALSAATADARFDPVAPAELELLAFDISVLGPAFLIGADDIEVGRHGLIVEGAGRRGLLLPQVAPEWAWDARTFLEQTCRKAGLPLHAWRHPDTRIFAFEAEVFGED